MKSILKPIVFLVILTILDLLFRQGLLPFPLPFQLPNNGVILVMFTLFALFAWLTTKWFTKTDKISLSDLGISLNGKNRLDFFYGFLVGVGLWAIVSVQQAMYAGFLWELRPDISIFNVFYGLVFICIADLGTELFTRGYPLTKLKDQFGQRIAIIIMVFFVGLKSYSFDVEGELLFYTIMIPALHTIFFSIIYFKTKRLGAALGVHTGANFITISIFDLRVGHPNQAIPSGVFQPNMALEDLSLTALQLPYVIMALVFSIGVYFWKRGIRKDIFTN